MGEMANTEGDFPEEGSGELMPQELSVKWDSPLTLTTREEDGRLIMPKAWRDEDDEEMG